MDSYRYLDFVTRQIIRAWVEREPERPPPWTPLPRPVEDCTVALISTAGVARRDDVPFDEARERENPWWGDPTFRRIPRETTASEVDLHHLHVERRFAREDLDVVLPLRRLDELVTAGKVGASAPTHYSLMGYILDPTELVQETAPRLVAALKAEGVEAVVLVPA
ncbi:MAG TPA: glycine/sarcosine/betaine reductase selenoprotein B family protein [Anaeromyxobacteraceae bacterium]|nr:glycine/sarcosine/betaine reductase selenoprotein B family protein [Anaeromyxobacteraceae bacterium]